jgi:hypothetical protein
MQSSLDRRRAMKIAGTPSQGQSEGYIAWLNVDGAAPAARCYVEDVSKAGAKVTAFSQPVANEFTLHFNRRGDAKVRCRVVSRSGPKCFVEFVPSLDGRAPRRAARPDSGPAGRTSGIRRAARRGCRPGRLWFRRGASVIRSSRRASSVGRGVGRGACAEPTARPIEN